MDHNKKEQLCIFCSCLISLIFILLIFSPKNIDPANTNWVKNGGGDNLQHYLGWRFYRESPWNRYLLFMRSLNYPVGTSVIVTDSNPLFCLFFKLIRFILPEDFQFNGIWILLSYVLTAFFAAKISWKLTGKFFLSLVSAIIAVLNPVILQRAIIHDTLTAHWIILFGIFLILHDDSGWNPAGWFVIAETALLVHFYFIPMLTFILVLQAVHMIIKKRTFLQIIMPVIVFAASIILGYYIFGYNHILPQSGSFGELSMNLNAFINPDSVPALLRPRPRILLQYEGFNYFGLGLIGLLIIGLSVSCRSLIKTSLPYLLPAAGLILIAASNIGYFDKKLIYQINLPEKLISVLSVFRSSGRLVWPIYYLVLFTVIYTLSQLVTKNQRMGVLIDILVVICAVLQFYDLHEFHSNTAERFRSPENLLPSLSAEFYDSIPKEIRHIYCSDGDSKMKDAIALFAAEHKMTFNRSANAREIEHIYGGDMLAMEDLTCDMIGRDSVYIYLAPDMIPSELDKCDGVRIIRAKEWNIIRAEE